VDARMARRACWLNVRVMIYALLAGLSVRVRGRVLAGVPIRTGECRF
jgi:hypothetical protein